MTTNIFRSALLLSLVLLTLLAGCSREPGEITDSVRVIPGPVNGVLIRRGGNVIAVYGDPREEPQNVEHVLFTHHRRDVVWAGRHLVESGAVAVVPEKEVNAFSGIRQIWEDYRTSRFHDYAQQSSKHLTSPLPIGRTVRDGQKLTWEDLPIEVMATPGYTRGSVSYLFEIDGRRIACVGDLIYGDGKILDLYSLQDAIPEANCRGYHGYAARAADVIASLRKIADWKPDVLIPARGPVIEDPRAAIDKLIERIQALFRTHFQTDALRWHWGDDNLRIRARRILGDTTIDWMPNATTLRQTPPRWMHKEGPSRLIVSDSGAGFQIDCGFDTTVQWLRGLRRQGVFKNIEGIFVTHYHDDHTDQVQALAQEYQAPVYAGPEIKDILENPRAYRMPAQTPNPIRPVTALQEGETLRWREFKFTYTYFPGQAIYHGGLLAEKDNGEKFFFLGDSFSPAGLDDYCILNRHLLHPGKGHFRCLDILKKLPADYMLVNQHVEATFRYDPEQLTFMTDALERKRQLIADLVPWDDPNFGTDEQWVRFYPYESDGAAGQTRELQVIVYNHSPADRVFRITPRAPEGWMASGPIDVPAPAGQQVSASVSVTPPVDAQGLAIVTADVKFGEWELREWFEALVNVQPDEVPRLKD